MNGIERLTSNQLYGLLCLSSALALFIVAQLIESLHFLIFALGLGLPLVVAGIILMLNDGEPQRSLRLQDITFSDVVVSLLIILPLAGYAFFFERDVELASVIAALAAIPLAIYVWNHFKRGET